MAICCAMAKTARPENRHSHRTAIRRANIRHALGLDNATIRKDLLREKQLGFTATRTFIALRDRYRAVAKKPATLRHRAGHRLNSPKLSRGFTTRRFAESRKQALPSLHEAALKYKQPPAESDTGKPSPRGLVGRHVRSGLAGGSQCARSH